MIKFCEIHEFPISDTVYRIIAPARAARLSILRLIRKEEKTSPSMHELGAEGSIFSK